MSVDVAVRTARLEDASAIAGVHVEVWRNAYPGMIPDHSLVRLSRPRLAAYYAAAIAGGGVVVAPAPDPAQNVVGFSTASRSRRDAPAEGEVETLYVLDDWRERGLGRALLRASARHLAQQSCRSLFLWVLADNPSRWFYERLGGRPSLRATTLVGGRELPQIAMVWNRIDSLADGG